MRIQDKDNCFEVLSNNDYESKVQHQTDHSSFTELDINNLKNFTGKVNSWILK